MSCLSRFHYCMLQPAFTIACYSGTDCLVVLVVFPARESNMYHCRKSYCKRAAEIQRQRWASEQCHVPCIRLHERQFFPQLFSRTLPSTVEVVSSFGALCETTPRCC